MTLKSVAALLLVLAAVPATAQTQQAPNDLETVKGLLKEIRINPYPPPRERSAQLLVAWIRRMDVSTIDQATIDDIASLLEDKSDTVRSRMAIALGNIGLPAKRTVPALEKAFVKAKDYMAEIKSNPPVRFGIPNYTGATSADSICFALMKLEAPMPAGCTDGHYEQQQPATSN
jgi:hypothetical protein